MLRLFILDFCGFSALQNHIERQILERISIAMFAIVRTGGKQYRVAAGDKIAVEKLPGEAGDKVLLDDILLAGEAGKPAELKGLIVSAEIIAQERGEKIIVFKKRRRHNYRRKQGHRQSLTLLRIMAVGDSKVPVAVKKEAAPKAEKAEASAPASKSAAKANDIDASNLSLISGVGPAIEKKLRAAGIESWNDIAAWDDAAIAKWDEELKLGGRATKEEWVEQAKELLDGKAPRAKIDQAEKASGKDK
jgi:large subunit ribosomal protein L21